MEEEVVVTRRFILYSLMLFLVAMSGAAFTVQAEVKPAAVSPTVVNSTQVDDKEWVTDRTGESVDLDLRFTNERGEIVRLGDLVDRPTVLLPIYFYCPNICSQSLANLAQAIGRLSNVPGLDYKVIALSFNQLETPEVASSSKANYMKLVGKTFPDQAWSFLTGDEKSIMALTGQLGFRFQRLDDTTFLHPAALMVLDSSGKIVRYVYGSFLPGDIDLGILAAAEGRTMLPVRRLLNFCFNYDPTKNQDVFRAAKLGIVVFFGVALGIVILFVRRKKH